MRRPLPSLDEVQLILSRRRTRPAPGPPPGAGKALAATLKALDARFGQGAEGLKGRWREIVGETLARRTEPVRITRPRSGEPGALEIRVEGPSAALIQHQAEDIIARVNLFLGKDAVTRLRIVQGPLKTQPARPRRPGQIKVPPRLDAPLDAAAEEALAASLEGIRDEGLRSALTRLGRGVARRPARD